MLVLGLPPHQWPWAGRGETASDAVRNPTDETQPGAGVPAPLHAAELSRTLETVLKNQFYLQNRQQRKT